MVVNPRLIMLYSGKTMWSKVIYITGICLIGSRTHGALGSGIFGPAQFSSDWILLQAQSSTLSTLDVPHGLGVVPGIVEVLVKSIEEPNKDFIFRAIGNGERDDDGPNTYGGVVYIYNKDSVRVFAPRAYNGNRNGGVIYTGADPFWKGVNVQHSMQAYVKVRCWTLDKLPEPCYKATGLAMMAGSTKLNETYMELQHGLTQYPARVNVRAQLTEGDVGWYSDAQGSNLHNFKSMGIYWRTGGLKFGYNNETIRIWTSSWPGRDGILFSRDDGWGSTVAYSKGTSRGGLVDAYAWCNIALPPFYSNIIPFGPSVIDEQLEVALPDIGPSIDNFFISIMVQATNGPNKGYMFDGAGGAMTLTNNVGTPCGYGGLVYAFNATLLRMWRPSYNSGAAVCIGDNMGLGTHSQASQDASLVIRMWKYLKMTLSVPPYQPLRSICSHFALLGNNTDYNAAAIAVTNVTSLTSCDKECNYHEACVAFVLGEACCLYDAIDTSLLYQKTGSQFWELHSRTECVG